jgi:unconventional prefoldin RPB5 interactor 1
VQENIKATEKLCQSAEEKLSAINVVLLPDALNEDGLPLTEIREDLDEDGNVIGSSFSI